MWGNWNTSICYVKRLLRNHNKFSRSFKNISIMTKMKYIKYNKYFLVFCCCHLGNCKILNDYYLFCYVFFVLYSIIGRKYVLRGYESLYNFLWLCKNLHVSYQKSSISNPWHFQTTQHVSCRCCRHFRALTNWEYLPN